jgi:precorrin-3B synthase
MRRGWCPTLHQPMETGDGLLVRLQPKRARLTATAARAIAAAARGFGNGLIDLSNRGNLQIRGIGSANHPALVAALLAAGIDDRSGGTRCLVSPLAGIDPAEALDGGALAAEIDAALDAADLAGPVPAKFAIVVDGGGVPLGDVEADIRFVAIDRTRVAVSIAGPSGDLDLGICSPTKAASVAAAIVSRLCHMRATSNAAGRIRHLSSGDRRRLAEGVTLAAAPLPPPRAPGPRIGPVSIDGDRLAVGLGLPYGRLDAGLLHRIAAWSEVFGAGELRLSPWRTILVPFVAGRDAPALIARAADAGLIVDEADPRRAIVACPGAPACSRASVSTHADAERLRREVPRFPAGVTVHFSGCEKGCARRSAAELTLVGKAGRYDVVVRGNARDVPAARMGIEEIVELLKAFDAPAPNPPPSIARRDPAQAES